MDRSCGSVRLLMKPLSLTPPGVSNHAAGSVFNESVCCSTKPVEGDGQERITLGPLRAMLNSGRPVAGPMSSSAQKPGMIR